MMYGLIDIERAEAALEADRERILYEVRAQEGDTEALNEAVRGMISASETCSELALSCLKFRLPLVGTRARSFSRAHLWRS